jgi:hypothetical protein
MLELLTQKPVLQTAVSSSYKPVGETERGAAPSVDEDGKSFSQSLEQETRAADAASSKGATNETASADENETADSQTGMSADPQSQSAPEVKIADAEAIDPGNTTEVMVEAAPQPDPQAATDAAAETRPANLTGAALINQEQTHVITTGGDGTQAPTAPEDELLARAAAKSPDAGTAKSQAATDQPAATSLDVATSAVGGAVGQAEAADTDKAAQQITLTKGAETAQTDTAEEVTTVAAPQVAATSAQTKSADQPVNGDTKTRQTVQPAKNGAPLNAAGEQQGDTIALKERAQTGAQDQDLAEAKTGKQDTVPKVDVSPAAAKPASFEAALTAQNQSADPAAALSLVKAPTAETLAAKPLPEVTIQVPQQRADMAAKQVGLELAKQAKNGDTHFIVRMDPPELGKLDVRMTINKAGEVQANILVERESTLDLLNRDARALERSLADAGLKMDQNALNLGLKNQDPKGGAMGQTANGPQATGENTGSDDGDDLPPVIDGATLAQIQISSGRPLDVVI